MSASEDGRHSVQETGYVYLERLRKLHVEVMNTTCYYTSSAGDIVDALKELAELVIWGDANNYDAIFDYFCEENLMGFLTSVLPKSPFRVVRIQLLQTVSMMLHNLENERTLYFMLSNNYINTLICTSSMYSGGDLSSWTASLLKTVSGLLNPSTIKFFYNEGNETFPLLDEALKFLSCSDSMKCTHVMTIILNIVRVNDDAVTNYMLHKSHILTKLALYLRTCWRRLNNQMRRTNLESIGQTENILLTTCDDVFQFIQDVMDIANEEINKVMLKRLFSTCLFPLVGTVVKRMDNHAAFMAPMDIPADVTCDFYRETYQKLILANGLVGVYAANKTDIFSGDNSEDSSCQGGEAQERWMNSARDSDASVTPSASPSYLAGYLDPNVSATLLKNELLPNVAYYLLVTHLTACRRDDIRHYLLLLIHCPFAPRQVVAQLAPSRNPSNFVSETNGSPRSEVTDTAPGDEIIFAHMNAWEKHVFGEHSFQHRLNEKDETLDAIEMDYVLNCIMGEFIRVGILGLPRRDNTLAMLLEYVYRMQKSYVKRVATPEESVGRPFETFISVPSTKNGLHLVLQLLNVVSRHICSPRLRIQVLNLALSIARNSAEVLAKYNPDEMVLYIEELKFHLGLGFNALKLSIVAELERCTKRHIAGFYEEWLLFDTGSTRHVDILSYPQLLLDAFEARGYKENRAALSKSISYDSGASTEIPGTTPKAEVGPSSSRSSPPDKASKTSDNESQPEKENNDSVRTRFGSWFFGSVFRPRSAGTSGQGHGGNVDSKEKQKNKHWQVTQDHISIFRRHVQVALLIVEVNSDIGSGQLTNRRDRRTGPLSHNTIYKSCPLYEEQGVNINDKVISLGAMLSMIGVKTYPCTMSMEAGIRRRHAVSNDMFFLLVRAKTGSPLFEASCIHPLWNVKLKALNNSNRSCTIDVACYPDHRKAPTSVSNYCKPRQEVAVHSIELIFEKTEDLLEYVQRFKLNSTQRIQISSSLLRNYFLELNV